jgi:anti-sigma factor RsiW
MTKPSRFSAQERADLVAYLDGELGGEAARKLETKLNLDPDARAEAEALKRTWDLLDYLPRPEPSGSFTVRTMSRITPIQGQPRAWPNPRWRAPLFGMGWAAALVIAALSGYGGFNRFVPREPGDRELVRDLRLIENKHLYDLVEDVDFLHALDQLDLFGEEPAAGEKTRS